MKMDKGPLEAARGYLECVGYEVDERDLKEAFSVFCKAAGVVMVDGWQSMDSAPKDGFPFLARDSRVADFAQVVSYDPDSTEIRKLLDHIWSTEDGVSYHKDAFTHWMPIPEVEAAEGTDG